MERRRTATATGLYDSFCHIFFLFTQFLITLICYGPDRQTGDRRTDAMNYILKTRTITSSDAVRTLTAIHCVRGYYVTRALHVADIGDQYGSRGSRYRKHGRVQSTSNSASAQTTASGVTVGRNEGTFAELDHHAI